MSVFVICLKQIFPSTTKFGDIPPWLRAWMIPSEVFVAAVALQTKFPLSSKFSRKHGTGVFRKAAQSLVRPWALILGGCFYGAKISVEYDLYLFPYTVRPTLYGVWKLFRYLCPRSRLYCSPNMDYTYIYFVCMCSCSDTGNMQLPYNSPGGYLVHVLFSQCVYFPINGPGRPSGKPR